MQLTTWESAVTVRGIYLLCRLLVVLFESYDLCYLLTRRSTLEICEIGEQGVSITLCFASTFDVPYPAIRQGVPYPFGTLDSVVIDSSII